MENERQTAGWKASCSEPLPMLQLREWKIEHTYPSSPVALVIRRLARVNICQPRISFFTPGLDFRLFDK